MERDEYHQDGMIHNTGTKKMLPCGEPPSPLRLGVTVVQHYQITHPFVVVWCPMLSPLRPGVTVVQHY